MIKLVVNLIRYGLYAAYGYMLMILIAVQGGKYDWMSEMDPSIKPGDIVDDSGDRATVKVMIVVCMVLSQAVMLGVARRRYERMKRDNRPDPFTTEEQTAILEALSDEERPLIEFAFWTGLRTSELAALEWQDINWDRKQFRVERALTQAARGKAETPKTASGIRVVDLLPRAIHALKQQWEISSEHPMGRVFLNPRTGEPWTGDQAIRKTLWAHALKRAGVRYRRQYQTRHTYASMMVSAGEPLAWVSKQMGHSDVLITARTYAQWIPQSQKEYGNKAHQLYG